MLRFLSRYALLGILSSVFTGSTFSQVAASCPDQLHYLSDSDAGYRYLESRQREIYDAFPSLADPFSRALMNAPKSITTFSDLAAYLDKQGCDAHGKNCIGDAKVSAQLLKDIECKDLPTRFESPMFIELIDIYMTELGAEQKRDYPQSKSARFGSLPTGTIDAQAMLPPGVSQPVVILNRDIFFFTGAFSKSVSDAIPIHSVNGMIDIQYSKEAIEQRLREHPYIVANFADAMVHMLQFGTSAGAQEVTLDADHNRLHARLVVGMDEFIIAHEDSHVILGHVSNDTVSFAFGAALAKPTQSASTPAVDTSVVLQTRTREQEFQADATGYRLLIKTIADRKPKPNPVDVMIAAAAPEVVFRIIDAAEAYGRAVNGRSFSDANHPDAEDRIAALDTVYKELSVANGPLDKMPDFRIVFDASIKELLAAADPLIRKSLLTKKDQKN